MPKLGILLVNRPAIAADFALGTSFDVDCSHFEHDLAEPECPRRWTHGVKRGFRARRGVVKQHLIGVHDAASVHNIGVIVVVESVWGGIQVERRTTSLLRTPRFQFGGERLTQSGVLDWVEPGRHGFAVGAADGVRACRGELYEHQNGWGDWTLSVRGIGENLRWENGNRYLREQSCHSWSTPCEQMSRWAGPRWSLGPVSRHSLC